MIPEDRDAELRDDDLKSEQRLSAHCTTCGNESGYDEETLKASTHVINGVEIVLCCFCEDDLLRTLVSSRVTDSTYELVEKEADLYEADDEYIYCSCGAEMSEEQRDRIKVCKECM